MIVKDKSMLLSIVHELPEMKEICAACVDNAYEAKRIERVIVKLIIEDEFIEPKHPPYDTDWTEWLKANAAELIQEAVDIVM